MAGVDKGKLQLTDVEYSAASLRELKRYMQADFPGLNMIPFAIQKRALRKGILHAVYLTNGGTKFGYAVCHNLSNPAATQIMYLAVLPEYRSQGLGGRFLELLRSINPACGLLLEVDMPAHENDGDKSRRIAFYRRNGLELIPDVVLNVVGHPMYVMADEPLHTDWRRLYKRIYCDIYGTRLFSPLVKVTRDKHS